MEIDDRIRLDTPEGVALELQLAGLGSRFTSALVDNFLQSLGIVALVLIGSTTSASGAVIAVIVVVAFLIAIAYDILFETLAQGRTPGKRMNGLRVVRVGGEPVTFLPAAIRNVLRIVDFLPGAYLVGLISVVATTRNQRLGDLAAGTIVIRERGPKRPVTTAPIPQVHDAAGTWDVTTVSRDDLVLARSFLARRAEMPPAVRARLAASIADRLRPRLGAELQDTDDEFLIEQVVARKASM